MPSYQEKKTQVEDTEFEESKPDSDTAGILKLLGQEFKILMINMLRVPMIK